MLNIETLRAEANQALVAFRNHEAVGSSDWWAAKTRADRACQALRAEQKRLKASDPSRSWATPAERQLLHLGLL